MDRLSNEPQTTLKSPIRLLSVGLHEGNEENMSCFISWPADTSGATLGSFHQKNLARAYTAKCPF